MRPSQQEPIIVLLDLLHRNLPSANGMTRFTIGSELPPVDVGMAVLAALSDIAEDRLHMATCAGYRLVHAAQGILGLVVIEFGNRTNRRPPICRVTVLAGYIEVPVRAARYI